MSPETAAVSRHQPPMAFSGGKFAQLFRLRRVHCEQEEFLVQPRRLAPAAAWQKT
jgi:hypothetical protein